MDPLSATSGWTLGRPRLLALFLAVGGFFIIESGLHSQTLPSSYDLRSVSIGYQLLDLRTAIALLSENEIVVKRGSA